MKINRLSTSCCNYYRSWNWLIKIIACIDMFGGEYRLCWIARINISVNKFSRCMRFSKIKCNEGNMIYKYLGVFCASWRFNLRVFIKISKVGCNWTMFRAFFFLFVSINCAIYSVDSIYAFINKLKRQENLIKNMKLQCNLIKFSHDEDICSKWRKYKKATRSISRTYLSFDALLNQRCKGPVCWDAFKNSNLYDCPNELRTVKCSIHLEYYKVEQQYYFECWILQEIYLLIYLCVVMSSIPLEMKSTHRAIV